MVLGLVAALLVAGPNIVGRMLHKTKGIGWETPAGSPSVAAQQHADEFFPSRMRGAIVMAVEAMPGTPSVLTEAVAAWSRNVSSVIGRDGRVQPYKPIVLGYYLDALGRKPPQKFVQSELVSADERMTVLLIQPTDLSGQWPAANALLQEFCATPPAGYTLHITGMPAVLSGDGCSSGVHKQVDTVNMNFECLFRAEMLTLPMALLIMAYIIKFPRLLLVPLLTVAVSFILAAGMMIPFMDSVPVPQDAPAAMGSVVMALTLDYTLFILSRFSEEHRHLPLQQCVDKIKRYTCRTIFVSGILVSIAFIGSVLLPERNIQGMGVSLGLTGLACVGASIVVTPAVLTVAGQFFTGFTFAPTNWGDVNLQGYVGDDDDADESARIDKQYRGDGESSIWLGVMRIVERSPAASIIAVLVLLGPILLHLPNLNITGDRFAILPMTMPAVTALRRVQDNFPVGILDPYAIVVTAPMQGDSFSLSDEVRRGAEDLKSHDLQAAATNLGLSPEEMDVALASVEFLGGSPAANLTQQDPALLAAAAAGAAAAAEKAHGVGSADSLRAAVRAAHQKSHAVADVQLAVAAAAAAVRAKGEQVAGDAEEAVRSEASKLGMGAEDAAKVAAAAAGGQPGAAAGQAAYAAAAAGAAAGAAGLSGKGVVDTLLEALRAGHGLDVPMHDVAKVLRAVKAAVPSDAADKIHSGSAAQLPSSAAGAAGDAAAEGAQKVKAAVSSAGEGLTAAAHQELPLVQTLSSAIANMSRKEHGMLLMPSGYAAMLDLCEAVQKVGGVASMVGPTWGFHHRIDWAIALALHANSTLRGVYSPLLETHVNGNRALLEVHTTFPSIGAGGSNFVMAVREAIDLWESSHPGYRAEVAGGAGESADTRSHIMGALWLYLGVSVFFIIGVVYFSFYSLMVPLRLAFALVFTLAATFGAGAVIYQTPLLHGIFPDLAYFDGISYEVVPLVTGVAIALGLDYDIFLVSRIVEFRLHRYSDRASIFRGVMKTGEVISAAGLIMSLAFTGLCFSDKLLFQQFGVLLIVSVLFDTFVVRTVLVPALMLIAQGWNWWPREMPPAIHDVLEGEFESDGGLSRPILGGTSLGDVVPTANVKASVGAQWYMPVGMIA